MLMPCTLTPAKLIAILEKIEDQSLEFRVFSGNGDSFFVSGFEERPSFVALEDRHSRNYTPISKLVEELKDIKDTGLPVIDFEGCEIHITDVKLGKPCVECHGDQRFLP
jgi:hypothetical protein